MLSLLLSLVCNSDSNVCRLSRSFFFTCVWLVPFAYFISLSINEFVLPCEFPSYRQEQQAQHMNAVGGQAWWNSKKGKLANEKEEAKQKEYAERVAQARMLEKARQKQIKKHMGAIKYYLMPHKRAKYDELYPPAKPGRR